MIRYERRGHGLDMLVKQSAVGAIVPWEATEDMFRGDTGVRRMLCHERRGQPLDVLVKKSTVGTIVS